MLAELARELTNPALFPGSHDDTYKAEEESLQKYFKYFEEEICLCFQKMFYETRTI